MLEAMPLKNDLPGYPACAGRAPWALVTGVVPLKSLRLTYDETTFWQPKTSSGSHFIRKSGTRDHVIY